MVPPLLQGHQVLLQIFLFLIQMLPLPLKIDDMLVDANLGDMGFDVCARSSVMKGLGVVPQQPRANK